MKQKLQSGFTLIEMLTVIGIMGLVAGIFMVNFAAFRGPRNLRIATNELISNLRKIQSYSLSSRNAPSGQPVKFYLLSLDASSGANPSYDIVSINSDNSVDNVETVNLPEGIKLRPTTSSPQGLQLEQPIGGGITYPGCVFIGFSLPFSRVYLDSTCNQNIFTSNPIALSNLTNSKLTIVLMDTATATTSIIIVNGITGAICVPAQSNSC